MDALWTQAEVDPLKDRCETTLPWYGPKWTPSDLLKPLWGAFVDYGLLWTSCVALLTREAFPEPHAASARGLAGHAQAALCYIRLGRQVASGSATRSAEGEVSATPSFAVSRSWGLKSEARSPLASLYVNLQLFVAGLCCQQILPVSPPLVPSLDDFAQGSSSCCGQDSS